MTAERTEEQIAAASVSRNDADIIAEYRTHNLAPIMNNGRPVSLYLAKMLRLPLAQDRDEWMESAP